MTSLTQWTWVWASSGSWWKTRKPGVLQSMSCKESDTTEWLNWTVDLQCCVIVKWLSYTHIYILLNILFSIMLYPRILEFTVLYSRTLLFIHSLYNGLHLLIPNSQSMPLPPLLSLGNHKSLLCVNESISVLWKMSHSVIYNSLWPHGLYSSWNSPGQNTGVASLSLLQRIFPTQGLNPDLPHCRQILYQ